MATCSIYPKHRFKNRFDAICAVWRAYTTTYNFSISKEKMILDYVTYAIRRSGMRPTDRCERKTNGKSIIAKRMKTATKIYEEYHSHSCISHISFFRFPSIHCVPLPFATAARFNKFDIHNSICNICSNIVFLLSIDCIYILLLLCSTIFVSYPYAYIALSKLEHEHRSKIEEWAMDEVEM